MIPVRRDLHKTGPNWLVEELRMHMVPYGICDISTLERAAAFLERRLRDEKLASWVQASVGDAGVMILRIGDDDADPRCQEWVHRAATPLMAGGLMLDVRQVKKTAIPSLPRRPW
ncbi:MAG: hypothetical protein HOW73_20375 [Polyangiaceae bacterium]|nr:hypothetical protein [Polyangiaceae bacterium]